MFCIIVFFELHKHWTDSNRTAFATD